jgi:DMSO/TMAO reductase YedYZ molybdopterin-dependent catalytic subunit
MKNIYRLLIAAVLISLCAVATTAQTSASSDVLITVGGEVPTTLKLTRADLDKFARHTVRAKDHDGKEYNYEGVAVIDILQKAGVKFGEALRGKALATFLLAEAADGYQAVYSLPELDSSVNERLILLADKQEGAAFAANVGPLKIIVPGDKTHARWVRQVKSFTIARAPAAAVARP